jgi:hypothetical protein
MKHEAHEVHEGAGAYRPGDEAARFDSWDPPPRREGREGGSERFARSASLAFLLSVLRALAFDPSAFAPFVRFVFHSSYAARKRKNGRRVSPTAA